STTFNVSIHDNFIFYSSPVEVGVPVFGAGVFGIVVDGTTSPSKFNLRITGNEVGLPDDGTKPGTIKLNATSSAQVYRVEYTGALGPYLMDNTFLDAAPAASLSITTRVAID